MPCVVISPRGERRTIETREDYNKAAFHFDMVLAKDPSPSNKLAAAGFCESARRDGFRIDGKRFDEAVDFAARADARGELAGIDRGMLSPAARAMLDVATAPEPPVFAAFKSKPRGHAVFSEPDPKPKPSPLPADLEYLRDAAKGNPLLRDMLSAVESSAPPPRPVVGVDQWQQPSTGKVFQCAGQDAVDAVFSALLAAGAIDDDYRSLSDFAIGKGLVAPIKAFNDRHADFSKDPTSKAAVEAEAARLIALSPGFAAVIGGK